MDNRTREVVCTLGRADSALSYLLWSGLLPSHCHSGKFYNRIPCSATEGTGPKYPPIAPTASSSETIGDLNDIMVWVTSGTLYNKTFKLLLAEVMRQPDMASSS